MSKNKKTNDIEKSSLNKNLFNTREAAKYLNLNQKQLQNYRGHKRGPKYIKIDHICFYDIQDLNKWKLKNKAKIKTPIPEDNLKDLSNISGNDTIAETKLKSDTNALIQSINEMQDLLDSKKGFFVNTTDVAIFQNIILALSSMDKEIGALKKKLK